MKKRGINFLNRLVPVLTILIFASLVFATTIVITPNSTYQILTNTTIDNSVVHLNVSNTSLVGYWSFDKTNLSDLSDKNNDGTVTAAKHNVSGGFMVGLIVLMEMEIILMWEK